MDVLTVVDFDAHSMYCHCLHVALLLLSLEALPRVSRWSFGLHRLYAETKTEPWSRDDAAWLCHELWFRLLSAAFPRLVGNLLHRMEIYGPQFLRTICHPHEETTRAGL